MQIALPHNLFTNVMYEALPEQLKQTVQYKPAAALAQLLQHNKVDIALLPVMDLIAHKDFHVSSKRGISFESELSNAYFYFKPGQVEFTELALGGDISSAEAMLAKIVVKELYSCDVSLKLLANYEQSQYDNLLLAGDANFRHAALNEAVNFAEEIVELLDLPYVNFVFCANDPDMLKKFEEQTENLESEVYAEVESPDWEFTSGEGIREHIQENISHVIYNLEDQDKEAIVQLVRLPYFHGIGKDIIDIRFV